MSLHILMHSSVFAAVTNTWPGADGGTIQALVADPFTPGRFYAGSADGGIYRSDNSGSSWSAVNTGLSSLNVGALALNTCVPFR